MPGVAQHQQQRPYRAAAAGLGVMDQAQAAEVHLHHLAGRGVLHPNSGLAAPAPVAPGHEALQGGVRHPATPLRQQLLDPGQLQTVAGEPPVDLVSPRGQNVLGGPIHLSRPGLANHRQSAELLLAGLRPPAGHAQRLCRRDVPDDGIPGQSRPGGDASLAVACPPAAYDFRYLLSEYLLVGHRCTSHLSETMVSDWALRVAG